MTRQTIDHNKDPNGSLRDTSKIGTFSSLDEANQAARADLLNTRDKDLFKSYEVRDENGFVKVTASCPEGEEMRVIVEEVRSKRSPCPPKSSKAAERNVYCITLKAIDYQINPCGIIYNNDIIGVSPSLKYANDYARTELLNRWGHDFFNSYEIEKKDGLIRVTALCPEGEEMRVVVEELQPKDEESHGESNEYPDEGY